MTLLELAKATVAAWDREGDILPPQILIGRLRAAIEAEEARPKPVPFAWVRVQMGKVVGFNQDGPPPQSDQWTGDYRPLYEHPAPAEASRQLQSPVITSEARPEAPVCVTRGFEATFAGKTYRPGVDGQPDAYLVEWPDGRQALYRIFVFDSEELKRGEKVIPLYRREGQSASSATGQPLPEEKAK